MSLDKWQSGDDFKDDFVLHVQEAWWGVREGNFGSSLCLMLKGIDEEDGEEVTQYYSVGTKFFTDDGVMLRHESGKDKVPTNRTNMGLFINAVGGKAKADVHKDPEGHRLARDFDNKDPNDARSYVGLRLHLKKCTVDFKKTRADGTPDVRDVVLPVGSLGYLDPKRAGTQAGTQAAPATPVASNGANGSAASASSGSVAPAPSGGGIPPKLMLALKKIVRDGCTEQQFEDAAAEIPEIQNDDALMARLLDGSLWAELSQKMATA